jgi:hypothetical protein
VTEAVKRLAEEETIHWLHPVPFTEAEAAAVYAPDAAWESVEDASAGLAKPEV